MTAPPRSPAAQQVRSARPGWRVQHMRAKMPLPAASSATVHMGEVGLASVYVVHASAAAALAPCAAMSTQW